MVSPFQAGNPITDPVTVFAIVLFIIFLTPYLLRRIQVPDLLGILLAGAILGPNGLHVLEHSSAVELFGTVGLLYIMFQAGLEIDLNEFEKTRNKSLVFGSLSFLFPQALGALGAVYLVGMDWPPALLLASMFASHTLIAYPTVSRLDLVKNEAVTITLGGTLIVNSLALLVLAVITSSVSGSLSLTFWLELLFSLALFVFLVLWVGPRVVRWFFRNVESAGASQYIFVLSFVFAASFGAKLAGMEAIIGAFLAGLAINRLVPATSSLMNRIDFVGKAFFIPFFLIHVGMLVDVGVLLQGWETLLPMLLIVGMSVVLKWVPALITRRLFGYRHDEGRLIFGLSVAQAASTLAAALVGYELGLINDPVLNSIIIMILVTCLISSFVVESAAKSLALWEAKQAPVIASSLDRILVPISKPENIVPLIDLAILIKRPKSTAPIYPLAVIPDDESARHQVIIRQKELEKAVKHAAASDVELRPITRVDLHAGGGIVRAIKELSPSHVIIGWHGRYSPQEFLFGTVQDHLLAESDGLILVTRLPHPLNTIRKMVVVVPENAEMETGFREWLEMLRRLAGRTTGALHVFAPSATLTLIGQLLREGKPQVKLIRHVFEDGDDFLILGREVSAQDLFVVVKAREGAVSHQGWMRKVPGYLARHFQGISFIVVYPEQGGA